MTYCSLLPDGALHEECGDLAALAPSILRLRAGRKIRILRARDFWPGCRISDEDAGMIILDDATEARLGYLRPEVPVNDIISALRRAQAEGRA